MKARIYTLLGMIGLCCMACNDFLDVEQKGKVIPQTVEDYDQMLNNSYNVGSLSNLFYMTPEVYVAPERMNSFISNMENANAYKWSEYQYLPGKNDENWSGFYARIAVCNEIIAHIDEATSTSSNEKLRKSVKGQAYADRAKSYFGLINMYAKPYSKTNLEEPGVPLILINDIHQQSTRASIGEIYEQICQDIRIAQEYVPASVLPNEKIKACRQGLYAFKSKVYLFMNEIDSAYVAINTAFEEEPQLEYFDDYETGDPYPSNENIEVIWVGGLTSNTWAENAFYSDEMLALYETDKDNRFIYHGKMEHYGEPFDIPYYLNLTTRTFAASAPEMYLLRAECLARKGMFNEAMEDLSTLRESRYVEGEDYTITASSKDDAIQKVKDERLREFAFTGMYWLDLRRYQAYGEVIPIFSRTVGENTFTLEPGSNRYTCSIPRYVIGKNPGIVQNPR